MVRQEVMRERLVDAALRLLARGGHARLSVRDVTAEAGVNVAAVTTAFGGRSALLDALLARVLEPVNRERARRFGRLAATADVEEVVRAFVEPLVVLHHEPAVAVRAVLAVVALDATADRRLLDRVLDDPGVGALTEELALRRLVPAEEMTERVRLAVGTVLAFSALSAGADPSRDGGRERLIAFVAAGLRGARPAPDDRGPDAPGAR
ncbi:TetR/AcrR family transcriptional regulator [Pseudonocardia sp. ICBG1293]|uniref:TetR/AcrR family transcriptional regulator n=1 Tax=Pseudonocardia sp. ICBG1293 TaxID=2844382 RepID=UPI001CCF1995|nr:TetR/AcrR family transcriptional regulator [Pseudonocardia sp. ICBG1293]